nr:MAG TPA: hypothetical protein [Caudoviricetes sp.]
MQSERLSVETPQRIPLIRFYLPSSTSLQERLAPPLPLLGDKGGVFLHITNGNRPHSHLLWRLLSPSPS